jgi:four helix bundle protein
MPEPIKKIQAFIDLDAWKEGHQLVLLIYKVTSKFPQSEIFALTNQLRRCSVSITSNIAEGFSRNSYKEKVQFFYISLGSTSELQNQILVARDVSYLSEMDYKEINEKSVQVHKIINGLIKKCKTFYT